MMADQDVDTGLLADVTSLLSLQDGEALDKLTADLSEHEEHVKASAWDMVPKVCEHFTQENHLKCPSFLGSCEALLIKISQLANPKEVLLVLLEQADSFNDDIKFMAILPAIRESLFRIRSKKFNSLEICLETLYGHIASLKEPQEYNLEGEERKILDEDQDVQRISSMTVRLLDFLTPFAGELSVQLHLEVSDSNKSQRYKLAKYLIRLLAHPLVFVDLTHDDDMEEKEGQSQSRQCANLLVSHMAHLQPDFHKVVKQMLEEHLLYVKNEEKKKSQKDSEDNDEFSTEYDVSELGLSCFVYLVLGESIKRENIPVVYRHEYLLEVCCVFATILLRRKESLIVDKGVRLFENMLSFIPAGALSSSMLDSTDLTILVQDLIQVIIYFPNKEIRTDAVKQFSVYINKYEMKGRHKLLLNLLHTNTHSGIMSFFIGQLKNHINTSLSNGATPYEHGECFTGTQLWKILKVVFTLPKGETTDLLDQNDRIMAALNLLRYLIIRDKADRNVTGIWDHVPHIEKSFLKLLRTGLNMSKAHYQMELQSVKGKKKGSDSENVADPEVSLTVGGQEMAEMSPEQRAEVVHVALHSFDMMELVLSRVEEVIVSEQRKNF